MRRRYSKILTLLIAAVLTVQSPMMEISAAQMDADTETVTQTESEAYSDAIDPAESVQSSSVSANMIDVQDTTYEGDGSEEERADAESEETEAEAYIQSDLLLNYLYIEEVSQESTGGNVIAASFGSQDDIVSDVNLHIENQNTGQSYLLGATKQVEDAHAFDTAPLKLGEGLYQVMAISFVRNGKKEIIDITEVPDMEPVVFGVMEDPGYEESDLVALEQVADGPEVQTLSDGQVESAVEESLTDMPQDISELVSIDVTDMESAQTAVASQLVKANQEMEAEQGIEPQRAATGFVKIFIDAGHDATHAGARANGINEEDITLKVAQYCRDYLLANYTNVQVAMCRTTAACPHPGTSSGDDNKARVADAQNWGANAYVSIHFNSAAASASGAMVFYPNSNYNASVGSSGSVIASKILEQLVKLGLKNGGIHTKNSATGDTYDDGSLADYYAVIRAAKKAGIPGVIVEHAFLTNASDAAFLKNEENLKKIGIADAIGIANAYNLSTEPIAYAADAVTVTKVDASTGTFQMNVTGATPVDFIENIKFKVYPTASKEDFYLYTATPGTKKGNYYATGGITFHNKVTGNYKVIAYACDNLDNMTQIGTATFTMDAAAADADPVKMVIKKTTNQRKVSVTLSGYDGAQEMTFKIYNKALGTKSMKSYKAEKTTSGFKSIFYMTDFKACGEYVVVAYAKDSFGKTKKLKRATFEIDPPSVKSITVNGLNMDKGTFQLRANKVSAKPGIKKVVLQVENLTGKKAVKTYNGVSKGSFFAANIDLKDFNYQLGKYRFSVIVTDKNEAETVAATQDYTFEMPGMQITAQVKTKETKLVLSAKNVGIRANMKGVRFTVWRQGGGVKRTNLEAKYKNGAYQVTKNISDFAMAGTYKVQTYVQGLNGKYTKAGKVVKFTVSDIQGGKVTTKKKSDTSSYFLVDSISANSTVTKVEVKAWPTAKASAKRTYIAQQLSNGRFRAVIDQKKHKGLGGNYKYEVTVTLKNGVTKKLLTGKFAMGEDSDEVEDDDFVTADGYHLITGENGVTVDQMVAYYQAHTTYPSFYKGSDAPTLKKFCTIYYNECQAENIRVEVAFVQAMKETNFLRYTGDVDISQYNFAGIGATGGGVKGNSFPSVTIGVRAQVQHLKAYANKEPLNQACVDPRFQYVARGNSPYVEWLGIPDNPYGKGWATAQNYGSSILTMIDMLKSY